MTSVFIGGRSAAAGGGASTAGSGAISADELATALGGEAEMAQRLLPVARESVERFAANAPVEVLNEAIIRLAAWLKSSPPGDLVPTAVGSINFTWRPGAARNALRNSGAAGLLAPWRRPRGLIL